jgi:hypothetical protein
MSIFRSENEILGYKTQIAWYDGTVHYLVGASDPGFASAIPTNVRAFDSEPILSATSAAVSGSVAAVRGNLTIASGTTVTSGYLYGTQGKLTIKGTFTGGSEVSCGLIGQLDLSSATSVTSPLTCIWGDCGATMASGVTAANVDIAVLYNTTTKLINSAIRVAMDATYLFDLSDLAYGGKHFILASGLGSITAKCLNVNIDGSAYHIPLYQ